jgi:DNA polymerase
MKESLQRPTPVPEEGSLAKLRRAAEGCRNCPLWKRATQTVFGAGSSKAKLVIVGEQPGDREDLSGKPFVGPAGKLLDRALAEAGVDRSKVWLTNAVKHFKWQPRGKVRLHQKPSAGEIEACKPWLLGELNRIGPEVLILLGATAARSLLGPGVKVTASRGVVEAPSLAPLVVLTVHPSSLLRIRESEDRDAAYRAFVNDLAKAVGR